MTATLNGLRIVSLRIVTPWRGVWLAEVDLDPDVIAVPTGKATISLGDGSLVGTVDVRASGRFVRSVRVRVVGGGGGWDRPVSPQHWHNDAGVKSTTVYAATAGQVGETVNDAVPSSFGADYVRSAGPASRVFGDGDWYVDVAGVTQTGARPAATPDASLEILSFDASAQSLEVSSDALVLPGTTFTDARFDGVLIARDVEQTFDTSGSRATVWCSSAAVSRLQSALYQVIREASGALYLPVHEYRVVSQSGARLNLQAVKKVVGLPDVLPVDVWPGMAGLSAKATLSQSVAVAFIDGDPRRPIVTSYDPNLPDEVSIDAKTRVHIAPSGGAPAPIARLGDAVSVFMPTGTLPIAGIINPGAQAFAGTIQVTVPSAVGVIVGGSGKADCGT